MVMLHGLATRWQIFRPLVPTLSEKWHVYALDLRGHGKSAWVPGVYDITGFVDDTVSFLQGVVKEPAVLVGHSMGGWVAAEIAAAHPEMVRATILIDTAIYPQRYPDDAILTNLFGITVEQLRARISRSSGVLPKALRDLDPDILKSYLQGDLVGDFNADTLLPRVSCPVLLLQGHGAAGGLMTDDDVERSRAHLPEMRHVAFPDAGHWLHIQESDRALTEIDRFLQPLRKEA
jgi:pimeloyl-ACP methyl ester carboxylesterase